MNTANDSAAQDEQSKDTDQYLTFMLGDNEYGVEILRVQSIQGWKSATPIPNSPDYVLGVTNLRGSVVPIVDLRRRFDLESREFGPTTVVIVVRVDGLNQNRIIGMVVDGVSEVYSVERCSIQPAPDVGENVDLKFVHGLSTMNDRMLILLDIDKLLNDSVDLDIADDNTDTPRAAEA